MPEFKENKSPAMKRTPFALKSGNKTAGSSFKKMGSSSPLRDPGDHPHDQYGDHPKPEWNTPESYAAQLDAVTPNMTDKELREISAGGRINPESGKKQATKWAHTLRQLQKHRTFLQSRQKSSETTTPPPPPVVEEKTVDPAVTLQEERDYYYHSGKDDPARSGDPLVFEDVKAITPERKLQIEKAMTSGKLDKLKEAVKKEYGSSSMIDDYANPQERQMAGDAMIDAEGNILPMSAASGQYSGSSGVFQRKASGFKMPGYGKRKK